jgi:predicted TIM-barrel fold metal-dependent hydrolase
LDPGTALIDRHSDTRFVIDHLAILQPNAPPPPAEPWADLPKVLQLAKRKNAVIKVSGHLVQGGLSVSRYLGSAQARLRCLGF